MSKSGKPESPNEDKGPNIYVSIMTELFDRHDAKSCDEFDWDRKEIKEIADSLGKKVPSNIGDNIYAIRHGRNLLPDVIVSLASPKHWVLLPNGKGKYKFVKAKNGPFPPDLALGAVKIPDATPEIVKHYALGDEQAVLARIRYNRLIDLFFGFAAYPLQSHLRTTVNAFSKSQIETDELYVGVDRRGAQYIIPVQAKGMPKKDTISAVQAIQDIYCCKEKFPNLICKSLAAQTIRVDVSSDGFETYTVALMELDLETGKPFDVSKVQERHYQLVSGGSITQADLLKYSHSI
jgi:hypothetical protein